MARDLSFDTIPIMPDTCGNCGQPIGRLERSLEWANQSVCAVCYARLKQGAALGSDVIPYASANTRRRPTWVLLIALLTAAGMLLMMVMFLGVRSTPVAVKSIPIMPSVTPPPPRLPTTTPTWTDANDEVISEHSE
jgi:hypothetical protein